MTSGNAVTAPQPIPPLENGDRLRRDEFERRYDAMPDLKKAELIDGVVFVASPVRALYHGFPHVDLTSWLVFYRTLTPGLHCGSNTTLRLDDDNQPQPDLLLQIPPGTGGRSRIDDEGYVDGAPELVAEIAASTVSLDVHLKRDVYRRFGVQEYLIWRVLDHEVDWYVLRGERYEKLEPDAGGPLVSERFPGLVLDVDALLRGDLQRLQEVVTQACDTPEHAAFVEHLRH